MTLIRSCHLLAHIGQYISHNLTKVCFSSTQEWKAYPHSTLNCNDSLTVIVYKEVRSNISPNQRIHQTVSFFVMAPIQLPYACLLLYIHIYIYSFGKLNISKTFFGPTSWMLMKICGFLDYVHHLHLSQPQSRLNKWLFANQIAS